MNYIIIFLISMIPLAELRVAIPTGIAMGVSVLPAYAICILGNLLPMPFVYLFSHRLLEWCIWRIPTAGFAEQNGRNAKLNGRITFDY